MNYNIPNSTNFFQFLGFKNGNKIDTNQLLLSLISTALKQSLAFYELQWKSQQNLPNNHNLIAAAPCKVSQGYLPDSKKAQEKHSNILQQNKKSIQKISYNSEILKNDKIEQICNEKQVNAQDKNCSDDHKSMKTATEYPERKRQKIIHQIRAKQQTQSQKLLSINDGSLIDLYQPAYIPENQLSIQQIQQKREKLLLRRVLNWKEIDKKVGFRKMELKKLLS